MTGLIEDNMPKIPTVMTNQLDKSAYITWHDDASFAKASAALSKGLDQSKPIHRSTAAIANRFQNVDSNTSVRDATSQLDYDFFRPNERTPRMFREIIAACMGAYEKVPVIKQIIDLMGDFGAGGIKLVHHNESIERFYNEWFRKVNGPDRTERILNTFYRCGNVIIKRADARLTPSVAEDWKRVVADTDLEHEDDTLPGKYEIPYKYTILNPLILQVLGEHVAAFTGKVHYVLEMPTNMYNSLTVPGLAPYDPSILTEGLPYDIKQAFSNNDRYLKLDGEKLITLFYKKDDWNVWAYPMLYSLLDEIILLQKMKRADMSALDGVISHIRVWKLGSMEHKIFPTDAAISKLSNILLNHLAGGAMDLVWGPDLELAQTNTDIANFLGSEKYEFCMNTIHAGLGIPAAIGKSKGSMTDNFMSIRVLIERLNYGRQKVTEFWDWEIRRVQEAMGFRYPAKVMFNNMNLHDEVAEKALWIQLAHSNIVSVEAVQERFGRIPELENILMMREEKKRLAGKMPAKTSPYHDAQPDLSLLKIGMQRGMITPTELPEKYDLHLQNPEGHDKEKLDSTFPPAPPALPPGAAKKKPTGQSGQGRPGGSKDKKKRKQRTPQPSSKAEDFMRLTLKANHLQKVIAEIIDPFYLDKFGKKNLRQLTAKEGVELEKFKMDFLFNVSGNQEPTTEVVMATLEKPFNVYQYETDLYKKLASEMTKQKGTELTYDDLFNIKSCVWAMCRGELVDDV